MPKITFTVQTTATIRRLELEELNQMVPIPFNHGVGNATLPSGYRGNAFLDLYGNQGTTAKFKITQRIGNSDVVLAERNHIRITSPTNRALSWVPFTVR